MSLPTTLFIRRWIWELFTYSINIFFIYSNSAKLRKAKWSPSKIKEHNSHSRQWLGQCLGQKDRRDQSVEVSVVQSLVMYVLHLILVFWVFFKRSDILVPRASELNPKCLQSFSVKRYVELKNWGMVVLQKATWNGVELVADEEPGEWLYCLTTCSLCCLLFWHICTDVVPCSVQDFLCSGMLEAACKLNILGDA